MDVRLLTQGEIPKAVEIARGVFKYCLQRSYTDERPVQNFLSYADAEKLGEMAENGQIFFWGAFENGQMLAMSAMQKEGHITMLYVLPLFQRRGCGKALLQEMRRYAGEKLGYEKVTVNAMPAWTADYFERRKFKRMGQAFNVPFISMQAKTICEVSFEKKKIPTGWLLGTSIGGLVACTAIAVSFMIYYFS